MCKGIIEVDIPMSCEECDFPYVRTYYNGTHWYCGVDRHPLVDFRDGILLERHTRSPQCPIKPKSTYLKEANNE